MSTTQEPSGDAIKRAAHALSGRGSADERQSLVAVKRGLFADADGSTTADEPTARSAPERPLPASGVQIGRYLVLETVGRGGMGTVFRAYDPKLKREVALKVLKVRLGVESDERLMREAQAMAKLSHPNVLAVHDVERVDASWCIVMEYVDGFTLREWLSARERTKAETRAVFRAAGEGLMAAHDQGLVHRDFKPTNVLVDRPGPSGPRIEPRVRVMDFGLARLATDEHDREADVVLGTPAYMAPEQHVGEPADARSDQFAFCVALWEGLLGERPFAEATFEELAHSKRRGVAPDAQLDAVPRPLREALVRGLAPDPEDRHASLRPILDALAPERRDRRRWAAAAFGLGAAAVVGGAAWARAGPVCDGGEHRMAQVWNDARREAVGSQLIATKASYAEQTWARVEPRLDAYAVAWATAHREACEASRVRGEQSAELMDRRMVCLTRHLAQMDALVGALAQGQADVVARAATAALALPDVSPCADAEALLDQVPVPDDPQTRARVEALRVDLGRAQVLRQVGRFDEARVLAQRSLDAADQIGYVPLRAEAMRAIAAVYLDERQFDRVEELVSEAAWLATRAGHRHTAAQAALDWMVAVGKGGADLERTFELARWAEALRPDGPQGDAIAATQASRLGAILVDFGRYDRAIELLQEAIDALSVDPEANAAALASLSNSMGVALFRTEQFEMSRAELDRALGYAEQALGTKHPNVATILVNLGNINARQGKRDAALEIYGRATTIVVDAFGPSHIGLIDPLLNVAQMLMLQGEWGEAEGVLTRVHAIAQEHLAPTHPNHAYALTGLAECALHRGALDDAQRFAEQASAVVYEHGSPARPESVDALAALVTTHRRRQRVAEAGRAAARALEYLEPALPPDDARLAPIVLALGLAQIEAGDPEARSTLERAESLAQSDPAVRTEATEALRRARPNSFTEPRAPL